MATTDTRRDGGDQPGRDGSPPGSVADSADVGAGSGHTARAALRGRVRDAPGEDGWHWKFAAGLGTLSLLGALTVVALPGTVVRPVRFTAGTVDLLRFVALLLAGVVGVFGLYVVSHRDPADGGSRGSATVDLAAMRPERPGGPSNETVGTQLDDRLERIGGQVDSEYDDRCRAYRVEENLESLAVAVVAEAADCSRERAREHVAAGTWTDDVRAAAFVGGPTAPERPLSMRIRDWANGDAYDRQVRATVDELAAISGVDRP